MAETFRLLLALVSVGLEKMFSVAFCHFHLLCGAVELCWHGLHAVSKGRGVEYALIGPIFAYSSLTESRGLPPPNYPQISGEQLSAILLTQPQGGSSVSWSLLWGRWRH